MGIVTVLVLGAVVIRAVVAFIMRRRSNLGTEGQGLSFLL
jgi:hypothetical protein